MNSIKAIYAIKEKNKKRILEICPQASDQSGIYCFYRIDENGFKHCYVGKATKSLLSRCADHLQGYNQHIDRSIKKYGLYKGENPYGYKLKIVCFCPADECDEKERYYIKKCADSGWQLKNVETGGNLGKTDLNERKPAKTYMQGLAQGYKNAQKEIKHLFDLHLDVTTKKMPPTKLQEKALQKFKDFMEIEKNESETD